MEIFHSFGDTKYFLEVPSGRMNNDITKMAVSELAIPLATGIRKAFSKNEVTLYSNISTPMGDSNHYISLRVEQLPGKWNQENLVGVFIEEQQNVQIADGDTETTSYDMNEEVKQRIKDLEQELQYTVEELETSNEELQATNEELYTVNAEHQSKIFELTELNNDIENLLSTTQIGTLVLDQKLCIRKYTPLIPKVFACWTRILANRWLIYLTVWWISIC